VKAKLPRDMELKGVPRKTFRSTGTVRTRSGEKSPGKSYIIGKKKERSGIGSQAAEKSHLERGNKLLYLILLAQKGSKNSFKTVKKIPSVLPPTTN